MIDLTIIIPTLNSSGDPHQDKKIRYSLRECLISLKETVPKIPIVIASNYGDPKPLPIETGNNVTRVNVYEQGQCKAVNAAVATTNTEWVMISNDDMVYSPQWFHKITLAIESNKINCISPKLVEPQDGAPTFIKFFCGGAGGDFNKQKFFDFCAVDPSRFDWIETGFNMPLLIKRELWDLVGGYDINYDPWGSNSDSDLEYKIKLAGYQPMQSQSAKVYHFSQTSGTFNPKNNAYWQKNFAYFEEKWGFPRTDDGIWEANFEIPYEKLKYKPKWAKIPQEN